VAYALGFGKAVLTMGKPTDITIDVKANLNVDRRTAETCLRLVEVFCNANSVHIIGHRMENGEHEYSFEPEPFPKLSPCAFPKVTEETFAAINAIGRGTHPNDL
jgi:hypothetical protein